MKYIDTPFSIPRNHPTAPDVFKGRMSAHLMADTQEELVEYAVRIGLKASWIQYPQDPAHVHFDLTGRYLQRVLKDAVDGIEVRQVTPREMARMILRRKYRDSEGSEVT